MRRRTMLLLLLLLLVHVEGGDGQCSWPARWLRLLCLRLACSSSSSSSALVCWLALARRSSLLCLGLWFGLWLGGECHLCCATSPVSQLQLLLLGLLLLGVCLVWAPEGSVVDIHGGGQPTATTWGRL